MTGCMTPGYEERIVIVRADDSDSAILRAEQLSRDTYESETIVYTKYAMAFHIFDEDAKTLAMASRYSR